MLPDPLNALVARLTAQYSTYSAAETARRVEAGQWINWPLFLSQPMLPVFLCLFPTQWALTTLAFLLLDVLWMRSVAPRFVSLWLSKAGVFAVQSKWLISPLTAAYLWLIGHPAVAFLAIAWPVLVLPIVYSLHELRPASALDDTQKNFLNARRAAGR